MAIAGLYNEGTFCLLTKDADGVVSSIHDRMPVLVPQDRYGDWFTSEKEDALSLIQRCSGEALAGHKVSMKINSPSNNLETLLEAI